MKCIVSDTSPINYLVLIAASHVLPALFGEIVIPESVQKELTAPKAPASVQHFAYHPPEWVKIYPDPTNQDDDWVAHLDAGERAALLLAQALHAELILIDEKKGRRAAELSAIPVMGVAAIIKIAGQRGLIDTSRAIEKLTQTNFAISPSLLTQINRR